MFGVNTFGIVANDGASIMTGTENGEIVVLASMETGRSSGMNDWRDDFFCTNGNSEFAI